MIADRELRSSFLAKREPGLCFKVQRRFHQHAAVLTIVNAGHAQWKPRLAGFLNFDLHRKLAILVVLRTDR